MKRRDGILAAAYELTYNTSIADEYPIESAIMGITGWPIEYRPKEHIANIIRNEGQGSTEVNRIKNRNLVDWLEVIFFTPVTLSKNTLKIASEFIWNTLYVSIMQYAISQEIQADLQIELNDKRAKEQNQYEDACKKATQDGSPAPAKPEGTSIWSRYIRGPLNYVYHRALMYIADVLSLFPWALAKTGQSITSPITAMSQTASYVEKGLEPIVGQNTAKLFGWLAALPQGIFALLSYATVVVFLAPHLFTTLTAAGYGSTVVASINATTNFVGTLPYIIEAGKAFTTLLASVNSYLGVSLSTGFLPATTLSATTLVMAPALFISEASLRYLASKISPAEEVDNLDKNAADKDKPSTSAAQGQSSGPSPQNDLKDDHTKDLNQQSSLTGSASSSTDTPANSAQILSELNKMQVNMQEINQRTTNVENTMASVKTTVEHIDAQVESLLSGDYIQVVLNRQTRQGEEHTGSRPPSPPSPSKVKEEKEVQQLRQNQSASALHGRTSPSLTALPSNSPQPNSSTATPNTAPKMAMGRNPL